MSSTNATAQGSLVGLAKAPSVLAKTVLGSLRHLKPNILVQEQATHAHTADNAIGLYEDVPLSCLPAADGWNADLRLGDQTASAVSADTRCYDMCTWSTRSRQSLRLHTWRPVGHISRRSLQHTSTRPVQRTSQRSLPPLQAICTPSDLVTVLHIPGSEPWWQCQQ